MRTVRNELTISVNPDQYMPLVNAVRAGLTDDLLKPEYRKQRNRPATAGHCYVASETLWWLLGGKSKGWHPYRINHEYQSHWYIARGWTVLDPTLDQYVTPVPYWRGKRSAFLTPQKPSQRAVVLMSRTSARLTDTTIG